MERAARAVLTHGRVWYRIDAKGQRPGRLAASVVSMLTGKYKPTYDGGADVGDHVVVVNTKQVQFSGSKWKGKLYRKHTAFPGGLRETQAKLLHRDHPTRVVELAVKGMLPKNKLRNRRLERLHLFEGEENPYEENIYADVELPSSDDDNELLPTDILRPGAELHVLEELLKDGDWKLVADVPAESADKK